MKLKDGFVTYDMDGEQIMVPVDNPDFSGVVCSNQTAAFIVDCLKKETTEDAIVAAMLDVYDVTPDVVRRDVAAILAKLRSIGALDE